MPDMPCAPQLPPVDWSTYLGDRRMIPSVDLSWVVVESGVRYSVSGTVHRMGWTLIGTAPPGTGLLDLIVLAAKATRDASRGTAE